MGDPWLRGFLAGKGGGGGEVVPPGLIGSGGGAVDVVVVALGLESTKPLTNPPNASGDNSSKCSNSFCPMTLSVSTHASCSKSKRERERDTKIHWHSPFLAPGSSPPSLQVRSATTLVPSPSRLGSPETHLVPLHPTHSIPTFSAFHQSPPSFGLERQ